MQTLNPGHWEEDCPITTFSKKQKIEALPGKGSHVAGLNFKTSHVGVYKSSSLIVSFAVTVSIWPREVVSCRNFILCTVATLWAMSLVGFYCGRASQVHSLDIHQAQKTAEKIEVCKSLSDNN